MTITFFSVIRSGIGWILSTLGILFFIAVFHFKLHSIKEPGTPRKSNSWEIFTKANFVFFALASIVSVLISLTIFNFEESQDKILLQFYLIYNMSMLFIIQPRYYISQNHNLKAYLSVYHHQPPPVLPWQLPDDFDPNSVVLTIVPHENE